MDILSVGLWIRDWTLYLFHMYVMACHQSSSLRWRIVEPFAVHSCKHRDQGQTQRDHESSDHWVSHAIFRRVNSGSDRMLVCAQSQCFISDLSSHYCYYSLIRRDWNECFSRLQTESYTSRDLRVFNMNISLSVCVIMAWCTVPLYVWNNMY